MAKAPDKGRKAVEKKAEALSRLEVKYVPVGTIQPNGYNPNRQSEAEFELLTKSIREDGFTQPIVVVATEGQDGSYTIVDGEHRFRAAVQLGYKELPVAVAPMSLAQARIATLRHNRARGSEDIELATAVLRDLEALGALDWAQDSLGLSDVEIERLLADIPAPEALAAEEYTPAWDPTGTRAYDHPGGATAPGLVTGNTAQTGENAVVSQSWAAADALREREQRIAAAKTEQEKDSIKKDTAVFRVSCIYAGSEADLVKSVLGDNPAAKLYELCKHAHLQAVVNNAGLVSAAQPASPVTAAARPELDPNALDKPRRRTVTSAPTAVVAAAPRPVAAPEAVPVPEPVLAAEPAATPPAVPVLQGDPMPEQAPAPVKQRRTRRAAA